MIKGFIAGFLCCALVAAGVSAFANSRIQSAEFNSTPVFYDGKALNLSLHPLISVVKDGETSMSNYMPLRAVLEQMGYEVEWDAVSRRIHIWPGDIADDLVNSIRRDEFLNSLGVGEDSRVYKSFIDNMGFLTTIYGDDPGVLALIAVHDYDTYLRGGSAIFPELWELIYEQ